MIYFLKSETGPIKIGSVKSKVGLLMRLRALSVSNPHNLQLLAVMHGNVVIERRLHNRFSKSRLKGEWFQATPDLLHFIDEHSVNSIEFLKDINLKLTKSGPFKFTWQELLAVVRKSGQNQAYLARRFHCSRSGITRFFKAKFKSKRLKRGIARMYGIPEEWMPWEAKMANAVHQLSTDSAPSFSRVGAPISGTTRPMPFCINKLIQLLGADKIRKATGRSRSYIYQCGRGKKIPSLEFLLGHDDSRRPGLLRFAAREPNLKVFECRSGCKRWAQRLSR